MELTPIDRCEAAEIYAALSLSFSYEERRDYDDFAKALDDPDFTVFHIVSDGLRIGFFSIWQMDGYIYGEHFAIYEPFRSAGYGGKILQLLQKTYGRIVLEIEMPETEMQKRRKRFYERNGFHPNAFPYYQPSFHGGNPLPMIVMSYPAKLSDDRVIDDLYPKIYHTTRDAVFGDTRSPQPGTVGDPS